MVLQADPIAAIQLGAIIRAGIFGQLPVRLCGGVISFPMEVIAHRPDLFSDGMAGNHTGKNET